MILMFDLTLTLPRPSRIYHDRCSQLKKLLSWDPTLVTASLKFSHCKSVLAASSSAIQIESHCSQQEKYEFCPVASNSFSPHNGFINNTKENNTKEEDPIPWVPGIQCPHQYPCCGPHWSCTKPESKLTLWPLLWGMWPPQGQAGPDTGGMRREEICDNTIDKRVERRW